MAQQERREAELDMERVMIYRQLLLSPMSATATTAGRTIHQARRALTVPVSSASAVITNSRARPPTLAPATAMRARVAPTTGMYPSLAAARFSVPKPRPVVIKRKRPDAFESRVGGDDDNNKWPGEEDNVIAKRLQIEYDAEYARQLSVN